jgi:hypothetical protein
MDNMVNLPFLQGNRPFYSGLPLRLKQLRTNARKYSGNISHESLSGAIGTTPVIYGHTKTKTPLNHTLAINAGSISPAIHIK